MGLRSYRDQARDMGSRYREHASDRHDQPTSYSTYQEPEPEPVVVPSEPAKPADTTKEDLTSAGATAALSGGAQSALISGGVSLVLAAQRKKARMEQAKIDEFNRVRREKMSAINRGQQLTDRALSAIESVYARSLGV